MLGLKNINGEIMACVPLNRIVKIEIEDENKVDITPLNDIAVRVDRIVGIGLFAKIWWKITKKRLRI